MYNLVFLFALSEKTYALVSILLIPKSLKILFFQVLIFNLILSALGVIMFHKGSIVTCRKNNAFLSS